MVKTPNNEYFLLFQIAKLVTNDNIDLHDINIKFLYHTEEDLIAKDVVFLSHLRRINIFRDIKNL